MVVYTVYQPHTATGDRIDRAAGLVFIKDGFMWLAALVPAIWLLIRGLWLEFAAFLAIAVVVTTGAQALGASPMLSGVLLLIIQIIFGFEAGAIQGAAIERRGGRLLGTVTGRNSAECERRFFADWLPSQPDVAVSAPAVAAPPTSTKRWHGPPWTSAAVEGAKAAVTRGRRFFPMKA